MGPPATPPQAGLMKTGTGSARSCTVAWSKSQFLSVPVPVFILPRKSPNPPIPCMRYRTITLGCKVNQYETELLAEGLRRLGYRPAGRDEPADLCAVNTCTVTADGDAKSRKAIRHLARENPGAEIIVMGCYATRAADELAAMPGVSEVLTDKAQLPALLARRGLLEPPSGITRFGHRHRAYVKVQDGCRMPCAYCIIPRVRPKLSSRPPEDVADEVRRLVDVGHREIVLTGIHLGAYGQQSQREASPDHAEKLADLVETLAQLPGEFRLRLSSLEVAEVDDRLLGVMADCPGRVCPHLHLSLQSGSDGVLRRMRRRYTAGQFVERCDAIRRRLDQPGLTTDVIVGFPGETDAEFAETCRLVERVGFARVHLFRFSPREGTPAATMADQVHGELKRRRMGELGDVTKASRRAYMKSLVGRCVQALVETPVEDRRWLGTADRYVPVELPAAGEMEGRLVDVRLDAFDGKRLQGTAGGPPRPQVL